MSDIKIGKDLNVYVIDWLEEDFEIDNENDSESECSDVNFNGMFEPDNDQDKQLIIRGVGLLESGSTITVNITGFNPYFYIKIPNKWTKKNVNTFVEALKDNAYYKFKKSLIDHEIVKSKSLYGFSGNNKDKFLKLIFKNKEAFKHYTYKFYEGKTKTPKPISLTGVDKGRQNIYKVFESDISPMIRYMHVRNINSTGWMRISGGRKYKNGGDGFEIVNDYDRVSNSKYEININYKETFPYNSGSMPPLVIASFDIESGSSHGDFPVPDKTYLKMARDFVTEYINLMKKKDPYIIHRPRELIEEWLEVAFHPYYNNNNINVLPFVKEFGGDDFNLNETEKEQIKYASKEIASIIQNDKDSNKIKLILGKIVKKIVKRIGAKYNQDETEKLSVELCSEFERMMKLRDEDFLENIEGHVEFWINLSFKRYYDNHNINCVYVNTDKKVDPLLFELIAPTVLKICQEAYRHSKLTKNKKSEKRPHNEFIMELTRYFGNYFPSLKGDNVIQIGTSFKKCGETDCFYKHIVTLKGCDKITNNETIEDENDGIRFPVPDIIKFLIKNNKTGLTTDNHIQTPELIVNVFTKWDGNDVEISNNLKILLNDSDNYENANKYMVDCRKHDQRKSDDATVIVESYDTEAEVLMAWQRLIIKMDPDIITGYNIFAFDFEFMYKRAQALGIEEEFSKLGRMKDRPAELFEQKLSSSAKGINILYYIPMPGRVLVDLYKVIQGMYKLDSYKLDYVSSMFLFQHKNDVKPQDIFKLQKGSDSDRKLLARYCLIDCILCNRLIDRLDIITNQIEMAKVCSVPLSYIFSRGQGVKCLSLVSKFCRLNGFLLPVLDRSDIDQDDSYEGAIVLTAMSGIYFVPCVVADFNSLYPSCIISENLSPDTFVGFVKIKKIKDVSGKVIGENIIYSEGIGGKFDNLPEFDYVDIEYDEYRFESKPGVKKKDKVLTGNIIRCRFAQYKDIGDDGHLIKGIIPTILKTLLASRKQTRVEQKQFPKGSPEWLLKEGQQLAFKITANSIYGQLGAPTGPIYFKAIAACVTATGRSLIEKSRDFILNNYKKSKIVYGDTDSVFAAFNCIDRYGNKLNGYDAIFKSIELCAEASWCISKQLKHPHNLEFEKAIDSFLLWVKKKYQGYYYTKYGSDDFYFNFMGNVLKRRDNATIVKHIFGGCTKIIMDDRSLDKAWKFVETECDKLMNGEFPLDMFTISKTWNGGYYAIPDQIAHHVLAQRIGERDPGNRPRANDRIAYAYVCKPDPPKGVKMLQGDRIENIDYIKSENLEIDYDFYLTNQIMNPITEIFRLEWPHLKKFKGVKTAAKVLFKDILIKFKNKNIPKMDKWLTTCSKNKKIKKLSEL